MLQITHTLEPQAVKSLTKKLLVKIYDEDILVQKMQENLFNEFLVAYYFLIENNEVLAYLGLYYNENLKFEQQKTFCIGNYEAIENTQMAYTLIQYVAEVAKEKGGEYLIANMQGSTWHNYRWSLHNDYPNFFLEPYNHIYYNQHFTESGFEVIERYFSSIDEMMQYDNPEILEKEKYFLSMGVRIRRIDLGDYANELKKIFTFNQTAFSQNFLYTPITEEVFVEKYLPLKSFLHQDFVIMAEDKNVEIIGVFFALPDVLDKNKNTLIIKSIARHAGKEWQGLGHVIGNVLYRNAKKNGFTKIIHAFMREHGYSTQISKNYSGKIYKNYALYGKHL